MFRFRVRFLFMFKFTLEFVVMCMFMFMFRFFLHHMNWSQTCTWTWTAKDWEVKYRISKKYHSMSDRMSCPTPTSSVWYRWFRSCAVQYRYSQLLEWVHPTRSLRPLTPPAKGMGSIGGSGRATLPSLTCTSCMYHAVYFSKHSKQTGSSIPPLRFPLLWLLSPPHESGGGG